MPDPKDKAAPDPQDDSAADDKPEALTLTQEQLDAKIAEAITAAVAADRKAQRQKAKAKAKAQPQDDEDGDEDDEDSAEIVRKAEQKAAEAAQRADEAEKKALLAEVKGKLTDWLGLNARDFIGNAPDIMLHIERQLSPGAKDGEVARVIEANAKAFIERTKSARKPASGAPVGGARNRVAGIPGADNSEDRQVAAAAARTGPPADGQRWSTLNYHG